MTDREIAQARAAMSAPVSTDPEVLGAVRLGLLAVPTEPEAAQPAAPTASDGAARYAQLAVRRRA